MHYPPDLNLASSYIPACLCLVKCAIAFMLFIFSPVRGWIGLWCLLVVDRILWNQTSVTILDVNAITLSLVGSLMVAHTRSDGVHMTLALMAIEGAWALVSALQAMGLTRMQRAHEIMLGACAVTVLSCLYQQQERTELLVLRAFVFVVVNTTLPYLGVMLQHQDIDTYVNVCRTLLVVMGEIEVACVWVVVHLLCIGYQMRGGNNGGGFVSKRRYHGGDDNNLVVQPQHCSSAVITIKTPVDMPSSEAEEQALLREALARRTVGRD